MIELEKYKRNSVYVAVFFFVACLLIIPISLYQIFYAPNYWWAYYLWVFSLVGASFLVYIFGRGLYYREQWRVCNEGGKGMHLHIKGGPHV